MIRRGLLGFAIVFVVLALLPNLREIVDFPLGYLTFLAAIWFWTAQATSWNILSGYSGYFSFGQGAFFGAGAYTTAILIRSFDFDYVWTIPFAGIVAVLIGLGIGWIAFRLRSLRGEIFALLTLAVPFILASLARLIPAIDGGQGVPVPVPDYPEFLGSFGEFYFRVTLAMAFAAMAIAFVMQHSRSGWALFAVRDAEDVAEGLGVPTFRHKMLAISINALIAGIVGSAFALQVGFVTVENAFNLTIPLFVIVMSVLGGRSHWAGPLIGAAVVYTLQDQLTDLGLDQYNLMLLGLILVVLVILAPNGLQSRLWARPVGSVVGFAVPTATAAVLGLGEGPIDWLSLGAIGAILIAFIPAGWIRGARLVAGRPAPEAVPAHRAADVRVAAAQAASADPAPASGDPVQPAGGVPAASMTAVAAASLTAVAATPGAVLVECVDVVKQFGGLRAVGGVSLTVREGELVGLVGPNGSGKTTLVGLMSGSHRLTSGEIRVAGRSIGALPPHRIAHLGIARTYQIPRPFESMSVRDNVAVAIMFGRDARSLPVARREAAEYLDLVGLTPLAGARPSEINLHERQLLEMARALATRPKVLLLDEALAGLNPVEIDNAVAVVRRVHDSGVAIVIVEHLLRVVNQLATRIVVLDQGRTLAEGEPATVMADPGVVRAYLGRQAHA